MVGSRLRRGRISRGLLAGPDRVRGVRLPVSDGVAQAAPEAFVRVNQLGYPAGAGKRAYLMSNVPRVGRGLHACSAKAVKCLQQHGRRLERLVEQGLPVRLSARLRCASARAATTASVVGGSTPASSPAFPIASASSLYDAALANALSFYENERDGADYIPSALRTAPAHLNDAERDDLSDAEDQRRRALQGGTASARHERWTRPAAGGTRATTSSSCRRRATPST